MLPETDETQERDGESARVSQRETLTDDEDPENMIRGIGVSRDGVHISRPESEPKEVDVEAAWGITPDESKENAKIGIKDEYVPAGGKNTVQVNVNYNGKEQKVAVNTEDPAPIGIKLLSEAETKALKEKEDQKAAEEARINAANSEAETIESAKSEKTIAVKDRQGNIIKYMIMGADGKIITRTPEEQLAVEAAQVATESEVEKEKKIKIAEDEAKAKADAEAVEMAVGKAKAEAEAATEVAAAEASFKAKEPTEISERNVIIRDGDRAIGELKPDGTVVIWAEEAKKDAEAKAALRAEEEIKANAELKANADKDKADKEEEAKIKAEMEKAELEQKEKAVKEALERAQEIADETGQEVEVSDVGKVIAVVKPKPKAEGIKVEFKENPVVKARNTTVKEEEKASSPDVASLEKQVQELEDAKAKRQASINPPAPNEAEDIRTKCEDLQNQLDQARNAGNTTRVFDMQERVQKVQDGITSASGGQDPAEREAELDRRKEAKWAKEQEDYDKERAKHSKFHYPLY